MTGRCEFHDGRHCRRCARREPKANEEPQYRKENPAVLRNQRDGSGTEATDQDARNGERLATETIGEESRRQRAEHGADAGAHQHDRGLPEGQVPFRRQHRHQKPDHEEIEEVDHAGHGEKDDR